jgi:glycerol-3-phosphate dehydrogenase
MRTDPATLDGKDCDLLVVGGGIHGVAVAREAALHGMRTVLLEKDDFASGTSSRSSRLIHGGLRYLEHGWLGMVRESCRERTRLLRNAPHLVQPLPTLMPVFADSPRARQVLRMGLFLYDLLSWGSPMPGARGVAASECPAFCPTLRTRGLRGGLLYHDAVTNDRLLTVATAIAAAQAGAAMVNHARVTGWKEGRVTAVDTLTERAFTLRPRAVVNATGPWADRLRVMLGIPGPRSLRTTRGTHVLLPPRELRAALALFLPDGRIQFLMRSAGGLMAGTTDVADDCDPDALTPPEADVGYVLHAAASVLDPAPRRDEVLHVWGGLRSLVHREGPEGSVPREAHLLEEPLGAARLLTVVGGKLTTHRSLAEKVMARLLGQRRFVSRTRELPLPGAGLLGITGLDDLVRERPALRAPLCPHRPWTAAEAVHAIRFQGACTVDDVLLGRLGADLQPCTEPACRRAVEQLLGEERIPSALHHA